MLIQNKEDIKNLKAIGNKIGFGNAMCILSALWYISLEDKGYPTDGAFITTCSPLIKDNVLRKKTEQTQKMYVDYIKEMKSNGL